MKRLLTLVLALAMVLSLAACGSKKSVQLTADGGALARGSGRPWQARVAFVMQQRDAKPAPQAVLFVRSATPRRNGTAALFGGQRAGFYSAIGLL